MSESIRKLQKAATPQEIATAGEIIRCVVGSTVHGLHVKGTDDRDEMGICLEPPETVIGLGHFEQFIYRTAEERRKHDPDADQRYNGKTPPSGPGDLDLVVYSLRKYARLAVQGNPTILMLLFSEPLKATKLGRRLQAEADMFASRQAGARFLGYLKAQKERLLGLRGQMRVTRTDLIEAHGYDTKFAMHAARLGYQGVEYLQTGRLSLPMGRGRETCMAIRQGQFELGKVIEIIEELERQIKELLDTSPLRKTPDLPRVDRFVVDAHLNYWRTGAK